MTEEEKKNKRWHLHLTHNISKFTKDAYVNDPLARMKAMHYYYREYCPITVEDRWTGKSLILESFIGYEKIVGQFLEECNEALKPGDKEKFLESYSTRFCKKLYEVIFVDEFDNFTNLGFYKTLDDSLKDINGRLLAYGKQYKLERGEVSEHPSTLGSCFDLDIISHFTEKLGEKFEEQIIEDLHGVSIRGFVYELTEEAYKAICKGFNL